MFGLLFLLFTLVPALEIWLLFRVGGEIGAFNTIMLLIVMGILGAGIARSQGRALLLQAQQSLTRGELPAGAVLHGLLIVAGGLLMLTPGFFTDVVGILFVLPGSRHLIALYVRKHFERQLKMGRMHIFTGAGGGGFRGGPFPGGGPFNREPFEATDDQPNGERDVTPKVIDVTPISGGRRGTRTNGGGDDSTEG